MTIRKKTYVYIGLSASVVLLAWITFSRSASKSMENTGCIPPPVQIAYPYHTFRQSGDSSDIILPPPEWEPQLSDEQLAQIRYFYSAKSMAARGNDIWFTANYTLARYRPGADELTTYTVQVDGFDFLPSKLFLAQDGVLWGLDHYGIYEQGQSSYVPGDLSWYNAENDRFEPVLNEDGILTPSVSFTSVTEDAQGRLWLIKDEVLFSFDPETHLAERVLDGERGYRPQNLVGAPDGSIWLTAHSIKFEGLTVVIRYDPRTDEIEYHGPPPGVREPVFIWNLYLDSAGRLWVDDYGWREVSPTGESIWYKLIRSPVFITDRMQGAGDWQYGWTSPFRMYESSNGLFWFSSGAGLVQLNFQSGEWCLLTTLHTPVVEDDDHNLWIAGNRQLYKYHLQP